MTPEAMIPDAMTVEAMTWRSSFAVGRWMASLAAN
jgi:hypothetical protein